MTQEQLQRSRARRVEDEEIEPQEPSDKYAKLGKKAAKAAAELDDEKLEGDLDDVITTLESSLTDGEDLTDEDAEYFLSIYVQKNGQ